MNVNLLENGLAIIEPKIFKDERGYFYETYNEDAFKNMVCEVNFVQDNESKSSFGVARGLHFQKPPYAQAKLVRVVNGAVFDVAVDIRKGSPTYGQWFGVYLSEENHKQFFIPRGFAHGFISLRDNTVFQYKCDNLYNKESEGGLYLESTFKNGVIPWNNFISHEQAFLSDKDRIHPLFNDDFDSPFTYDNEIDEQ